MSGLKSIASTNNVLPKAWWKGFGWAFVQGFILRLNLVLKTLRLQQYPTDDMQSVELPAYHRPCFLKK